MTRKEQIEFAKKEIDRLSKWLADAERTWIMTIKNMEMGELKEYKELCQRQENTMNILKDWLSMVENEHTQREQGYN